MRHFIFTLGSEFESIQHNYRIGNLPSDWNTNHWPTLIILCCDYFNLVKPQGANHCDQPTEQNIDRIAQQKKVREWFLHPSKFCKEIEKEQKKFPDKCIYHLSKTHTTNDCHVRNECLKLFQEKKELKNTSETGQLRHLTDENFEDAMTEDLPDTAVDMSNDTNQDVLNYFARVTNHYLRLARSTLSHPNCACYKGSIQLLRIVEQIFNV